MTVLLKSGKTVIAPVHLYLGACNFGDPTAYAVIGDKTVWVKPGESVPWVEV